MTRLFIAIIILLYPAIALSEDKVADQYKELEDRIMEIPLLVKPKVITIGKIKTEVYACEMSDWRDKFVPAMCLRWRF